MKVLVTGGLGFIGSHLTDELIKQGHSVRVIDNLLPQVHAGKLPDYANPKAEVIIGDVCKAGTWLKALDSVEVVFHYAARVGLGQSQYQINDFVNVNVGGTAQLLDFLANNEHSVKKLFVAGSNTMYGEGLYECPEHGLVEPLVRSKNQIIKSDWDLHCPICSKVLKPLPTPETKSLQSNNIYSLTKKYQEELCLSFGKTYNLPVVSTRFFNVYGPRQSLSNPYTGVAAIFLSRLLNANKPVVYEDGLQTRDFVHVTDVARASTLLMNKQVSGVFNIGTGNSLSIKKLAELLAQGLGVNIKPEITNKGRAGDIRHCTADNTKLKKLGFKFNYPSIDINTLLSWAEGQKPVDGFDKVNKELKEKGLI